MTHFEVNAQENGPQTPTQECEMSTEHLCIIYTEEESES